MICLRPKPKDKKGLRVLCLGAHCDDIEIGCGGTILKWIESDLIFQIIWVVFSSDENRRKEAQDSANRYLEKTKEKEIIILDYRDAFLHFAALEIKEFFEQLKSKIDPDIVFTHYRGDRHQDHRLLSDLAWNTFRSHLILEYEIPKYDGDLGIPNTFVSLPRDTVDQKLEWLLKYFPSQASKHWFDRETFLSLLRIRGLECNSPSRYAESFHMRKCML